MAVTTNNAYMSLGADFASFYNGYKRNGLDWGVSDQTGREKSKNHLAREYASPG